jgi:hypothetical protein
MSGPNQQNIETSGPASAAERRLRAYPSATERFVHEFLAETGILVDFLLDEPLWQRATDAFVSYRSRSGSPKRVLVDFVVAAHALLRADRLMTLDAARCLAGLS